MLDGYSRAAKIMKHFLLPISVNQCRSVVRSFFSSLRSRAGPALSLSKGDGVVLFTPVHRLTAAATGSPNPSPNPGCVVTSKMPSAYPVHPCSILFPPCTGRSFNMDGQDGQDELGIKYSCQIFFPFAPSREKSSPISVNQPALRSAA